MAKDIVYSGECSICTCKECVCCDVVDGLFKRCQLSQIGW